MLVNSISSINEQKYKPKSKIKANNISNPTNIFPFQYNQLNGLYFKAQDDSTAAVKNDNKVKKISALAVGGILLGGIIGIVISRFRKGSNVNSVKPMVENTVDILKGLMQNVKPENAELASAVYPVLLKNSETLKIKPDDFENILRSINNTNKDFMVSEGIDLIASKMDKLKEIVCSPAEDIQNMTYYLTSKNKSIFSIIADDPEFFKLKDSEDISTYLKNLNPENNEYMFNELMPILKKYEKPLRIDYAENYVSLLKTITKDTQDIIPNIADINVDKQLGRKCRILVKLNADNKNCAIPLLENAEKFNLNATNIIKMLSGLKNEQVPGIYAVADNIENVENVGLKLEDLFRILTSENEAKIFDMVIKDPKTYMIKTPTDIQFYLKSVDVKNLDFIKNSLVPKLLEHKDDIEILTSDFFADLMHYMTPKTIDSIDIVAPYAKKYDQDTIPIVNLLCGVTEDNIKNLPEFLEKLPKLKAEAERTTGYWDATLLPNEVTEMLDNISKL